MAVVGFARAGLEVYACWYAYCADRAGRGGASELGALCPPIHHFPYHSTAASFHVWTASCILFMGAYGLVRGDLGGGLRRVLIVLLLAAASGGTWTRTVGWHFHWLLVLSYFVAGALPRILDAALRVALALGSLALPAGAVWFVAHAGYNLEDVREDPTLLWGAWVVVALAATGLSASLRARVADGPWKRPIRLVSTLARFTAAACLAFGFLAFAYPLVHILVFGSEVGSEPFHLWLQRSLDEVSRALIPAWMVAHHRVPERPAPTATSPPHPGSPASVVAFAHVPRPPRL